MTTKEQYHRINHLERLYAYKADAFGGMPPNFIVRELKQADKKLYRAALHSLAWQDEPMSGWVNNDRRMKWEQLRDRKVTS